MLGEDDAAAADQTVAAQVDPSDLLVPEANPEQFAGRFVHDHHVLAVGSGRDAVGVDEAPFVVDRRIRPLEEDGELLLGGSKDPGAETPLIRYRFEVSASVM